MENEVSVERKIQENEEKKVSREWGKKESKIKEIKEISTEEKKGEGE